MNDERRKNTPEEVAAIYAAASEGKKIEYRYISEEGDKWVVYDSGATLIFNFGRFQYRIKPEPPKPRVIYVNEYLGGNIDGNAVNLSVEGALSRRGFRMSQAKTIRFIEDLNWKEGDPE